MTNLVTILACLSLFCGCAKWPDPPEPPLAQIVKIDGCEYLKVDAANLHFTLTHKGNCTNHPAQ